MAEPPESATEEVAAPLSTEIVTVPVGVTDVEVEAEYTLIVMTSLAPTAGVVVAAESDVVEGDREEEDAGHTESRL